MLIQVNFFTFFEWNEEKALVSKKTGEKVSFKWVDDKTQRH
jgi:hypothetical protein